MKKIAILFALLLGLSSGSAQAAYVATGWASDTYETMKASNGHWYGYQYEASSESGSDIELLSFVQNFVSFVINMDGNQYGHADNQIFFYNLHFGNLYMNYRYEALATPLPAALPMFGAALLGVGLYRRRKEKAVA